MEENKPYLLNRGNRKPFSIEAPPSRFYLLLAVEKGKVEKKRFLPSRLSFAPSVPLL